MVIYFTLDLSHYVRYLEYGWVFSNFGWFKYTSSTSFRFQFILKFSSRIHSSEESFKISTIRIDSEPFNRNTRYLWKNYHFIFLGDTFSILKLKVLNFQFCFSLFKFFDSLPIFFVVEFSSNINFSKFSIGNNTSLQ